MRDTLAAEWHKITTLRSTYAFVSAALAVTAAALLILIAMIHSYDGAAPAQRAAFEPADPSGVVLPFVMFFLGAAGALTITGPIAPDLLAVPRRGLLLGAKALVAALLGLAAGALVAVLSTAGAALLVGDRPAPLDPWPAWTDALPGILGAALVVPATVVVAVGLGAVLRSSAATLTTLGGLILVAPAFTYFLPDPWQLRTGSVLLPHLPAQLFGDDHPYLLSPAGAALVLAAYVTVALTAGIVVFHRRDV